MTRKKSASAGYVDAVADEQGRVDVTINVMPQVRSTTCLRWPTLTFRWRSAADFLVARGHPQGPSVSRPWFADWGRDTLLSIPGLLLVDGRTDEAEAMLEPGRHRFGGRIPIASWMKTRGGISVRRMQPFSICMWLVLARSHRSAICPRLIATACRSIVEAWLDGASREPLSTATDWWWPKNRAARVDLMDAVVDGIPITPRMGKPVELSALWCHSLRVLAERASDDAEGGRLRRIAERTAGSLRFYCDQTGLVDRCIRPEKGVGWTVRFDPTWSLPQGCGRTGPIAPAADC